MARADGFAGITAAFWGLTAVLIGFVLFVASVGGEGLVRALLAAMAAYSILGVFYGTLAARRMLARMQPARRPGGGRGR